MSKDKVKFVRVNPALTPFKDNVGYGLYLLARGKRPSEEVQTASPTKSVRVRLSAKAMEEFMYCRRDFETDTDTFNHALKLVSELPVGACPCQL
ncbi:hypothetical protein [Desulfovibrio ferrophilus]|uniref:Protein export proteins SecD/SecF fusion n=1 Tax=Desulfovibrio ferrophilus TaxID=241368 RepID=A0A2Z6B3R4_9BACT|nr:hypothetical protein [Desulfovibrio ferrophilus]BBD10105.1 protein export proteins SecD/SecF fusion [Desulfovibrio ferrophilus]